MIWFWRMLAVILVFGGSKVIVGGLTGTGVLMLLFGIFASERAGSHSSNK